MTLLSTTEGCWLLDEQLVEWNRREYSGDGFGGGAVAVGILHAAKLLSERRTESPFESVGDFSRISGRVDDVAGAFATLLSHPDINNGKRKRRGFHDAAR